MRKHSAITAALVLLTAGLAWAGPRLAGTVVRLDTRSGIIVMRNAAGLKTIRLEPNAKVERGGSGSRLSAFHVGDPIQVEIIGSLGDSPLRGVSVYDNATAAALPPPAQPAGVYGVPHGSIQSAGGAINTGNQLPALEAVGDGGATDQNMQHLQNQSLTTPPGPGQMMPNSGNPYNPNNPYNPQYQYNPGASPYGMPYQPNQAMQNPQNQPAQVPATGWSNQAPVPPTPTTNNGTGWSSNTPVGSPGWSAGVQNQATDFSGLVRNVDQSRGMIYVAPMTGGPTVGVKIGNYTQIYSGANQRMPFQNVQPGVAVRVNGSMAGNVFIASVINVGK